MDRARPGALRERNRLMVIDVLRRRGNASQADIARETGLSRTSVSNLVAELREAGLVVERDGALAENIIRPGQRPGGSLAGSPAVMTLADHVAVGVREAVAAGS